MYDAHTEDCLAHVCPDLAMRWRRVREQFLDARGLTLRITEGVRTFAQQWAVWGQGRVKNKSGVWTITDIRKIVTFSRPGESYHQYGLAIDVAFSGTDPYLEKLTKQQSDIIWLDYGRICRDNHLVWGGDWKKRIDRPHCELTYGLSVHELQSIYELSGFKGVFAKCKQLYDCGGISK